MIKIHFIVNPIAGSGRNTISKKMLQDYFEVEMFDICIKFSNYKGHSVDLTKESVHQKVDIIVACGGDGTINEVASVLVGTSILFGIVPKGSGNGLASHLGIPKNINKALNKIRNGEISKIDAGCVNKRYFFSNTGFGFDANVIQNYEALNRRTLYCYLKATVQSFLKYNKRKEVIINIDGNYELMNPFLIFISNSNQLGYNFSLTPSASLQDGLLDIVIVPKISRLKILLFGFYLLIKKPRLFKEAKYYRSSSIFLAMKKGEFFSSQIDGEFSIIENNILLIDIKKNALNVIM